MRRIKQGRDPDHSTDAAPGGTRPKGTIYLFLLITDNTTTIIHLQEGMLK